MFTDAQWLPGHMTRKEDEVERLRYPRDQKSSEQSQMDGKGKAYSNVVSQLALHYTMNFVSTGILPVFRNPSNRLGSSSSRVDDLLPCRLEESSFLLESLMGRCRTLRGLSGTHTGMDMTNTGDNSAEQLLVFLSHVENTLTGDNEMGEIGRDFQTIFV